MLGMRRRESFVSFLTNRVGSRMFHKTVGELEDGSKAFSRAEETSSMQS